MNGNALYEVARQRVADQQRAARQAGQAHERRAAVRAARRARKETQETIAVPAIPDFAHEMFGTARGTVPAPREEAPRGRHAGTNRG